MLADLDSMFQERLSESGGPLTARERRQADLDLEGQRPRRRSRWAVWRWTREPSLASREEIAER